MQSELANLSPIRVLLGINDENFQAIIIREFENTLRHFRIDSVANNDEFNQQIQQNNYDLFILDLTTFNVDERSLIELDLRLNQSIPMVLLKEPSDSQIHYPELENNAIDIVIKSPQFIKKLPLKAFCFSTKYKLQKKQELILYYFLDEQKLATIGSLTGGIAHNISAPLTGIIGYAELIKIACPELEEVDSIIQQARRIDEIVKNLMLKTRQLQDKKKIRFSLNDLLKKEIEFLKANLTFKHEVIREFQFDDTLPPIEAIYSDIAQSIINILNFVIDALRNSETKKLLLKTAFNNEQVVLEINCVGVELSSEKFSQFLETDKLTADFGPPADCEMWNHLNIGLLSALTTLAQNGTTVEMFAAPAQGTTILVKFPVAPKLNVI